MIPTYGYLEEEYYARLKRVGKIALAMYLPEKSVELRYQPDRGKFRTNIDGHPAETAFAGTIHDVYHAMREMAMSENVAKARMRLAQIARYHPKNKPDPANRAIDTILIDGELIYSWPPTDDTIFEPEYRALTSESFGDLFYTNTLKFVLHEDLKRAFIEDMVVYKEEWRNQFQLGKSDLREMDQIIYEEMEIQLRKSVNHEMETNSSSSLRL